MKSDPLANGNSMHPASDPLDPSVLKWLCSLEPRQELVVRYAMRSHFAKVRGDRAFSARIEEVRSALNPDETQLAMILADANEVAKHVEELIGEPHPKQRRISG